MEKIRTPWTQIPTDHPPLLQWLSLPPLPRKYNAVELANHIMSHVDDIALGYSRDPGASTDFLHDVAVAMGISLYSLYTVPSEVPGSDARVFVASGALPVAGGRSTLRVGRGASNSEAVARLILSLYGVSDAKKRREGIDVAIAWDDF